MTYIEHCEAAAVVFVAIVGVIEVFAWLIFSRPSRRKKHDRINDKQGAKTTGQTV